ncbi:MAG: DUF4156 domain-containing protein [Polyangiaceae bacterium]
MMRLVVAVLVLSAGCADELPDYVVLAPAAEDVEIATDSPSPNAYQLIGEVRGQAAADDVDRAQAAARNDLRNKAAALGASLVTIDEDTGEAVLLEGKTKVTLSGRAYKSVD